MRCPHCGHGGSRVVETRENDSEDVTRRRRECKECGDRFTTYERLEVPGLKVVKSDGETEPFDREKLRKGIEKACEKRPLSEEEIEGVVRDVEMELKAGGDKKIESCDIGDLVIQKLKELDEVAYLRFASVYNSFDDVSAFQEEAETLKTNS
ncbi:MAG: transcriptional regulator NrdR [Candidatus Nanohaloarchaea archaeon]